MNENVQNMRNGSVHSSSAAKQFLGLAGWVLLCFSAAGSAVFVSTGGWYESLNKPSWNPPSAVFGPVWSTLYLMMAIAAWLVWREGGWKKQWPALAMFILQWMLNALWTPLFFGWQKPGFAFVDIVLLWLALFATIYLFWGVKRWAGLLLLPYLAWVSFAAFLNFTIWQMNS
jgi:translocator protein